MKKALLFSLTLSLSACAVLDVQDSRDTASEWRDRQILIDVASKVNKPAFQSKSRINAASYEGHLLLIGQAQTDEIKNNILEKIKEIKGVKEIYDQIRIQAPVSLSVVSQDIWLTTKVKSALIASKKLREANIKVITEDSEVFLLGYLTKEQATQAAEITRNIKGVKQVIKGFRYIN